MRLPNRSDTDHATLALLELAVVPIAVAATFGALVLADVVVAVLRTVTAAMGGGDAIAELGTAAIAFGTLLGLAAGGGLLVVGYRRYFDSRFDTVGPLPLLLVPAVGIAVPIGYAIWDAGTLRLSSRLFFPVAISAHALAYRTIAIDSVREDRGRASSVVGALTALPVVVALVGFANGTLGSGRPVGRTLEAVVVGPGSPLGRAAVIAAPVLVTALYAVGTRSETPSWRSSRDWSVPKPRLPRLGRLFRNRSDPSGRQPAGAATGRASSESGRSAGGPARPNRHRTSSAVVPSSPGTDATRHSRSRSDDGDGDGSQSADERASDSPAAGDRSADPEDATARDDGSTSGARDDAGPDESASDENAAAAAGSTADGTGSDTQIFTDDFDQYVADETPVERCPDCDDEIPSDGVYNFCPFCGAEL